MARSTFPCPGIFFGGQAPKSVNLYWRRFRMADIPLNDQEKFDKWLRDVWYEKDKLLEEYYTTGRFPPSENDKKGYIETEVKARSLLELLQIFVVVGVVAYLYTGVKRIWANLLFVLLGRK